MKAQTSPSSRATVAPYVGAWIEIWRGPDKTGRGSRRSLRRSVDWNRNKETGVILEPRVAPYVGAWIEIWPGFLNSTMRLRRSLRRSVDWNLFNCDITIFFLCRSLRRSVDWNRQLLFDCRYRWVAPYVGAWIEIVHSIILFILLICHSSRRSVDWNLSVCTL